MRNMAIVAMIYPTNKKNDNEKEHCVECQDMTNDRTKFVRRFKFLKRCVITHRLAFSG